MFQYLGDLRENEFLYGIREKLQRSLQLGAADKERNVPQDASISWGEQQAHSLFLCREISDV